ncbi:hypothetical protein DSM112329_03361 [Paraconexibacter sp. AEG42_29]|uniref:PucR family transcriptional regulator n=1 Tax=Paraconexibacter sp. AEG42_29 TaxID=2997339 RepID=A0AAU7AXQ0_9ACTN
MSDRPDSTADPFEPEVRALAGAWLERVEPLAEDMYVHLEGRIQAVGSSAELGGLTKASCRSNVETILSMLVNGIPAAATEAPVTALEHARAMAKRGAEVDDTLRFYRLGHGYLVQHWTAELSRRVADRERMLRAVEQSTVFMVEYIDIVSSRVSAEHLAERERRQRRASVVRADVVRTILDGVPFDRGAAERVLGYRLDRPQLAFLCWTPGEAPELERAAQAIAEALGDGRPLLLPEGPQLIAGWASPPGGGVPDWAAVDAAIDRAPGQVAAAFGAVQPGPDGFRRSRDEAERARRVAVLTGVQTGTAHFDDSALLDLLTADLPAARDFVRSTLGELARPDAATATVRATLLTVLAPRGGIAAAARVLGVHRNTVLQRVHRGEDLRGRPLDDRPTELFLALVLAERLGPAPEE